MDSVGCTTNDADAAEISGVRNPNGLRVDLGI
jgi:hypothetical protein